MTNELQEQARLTVRKLMVEKQLDIPYFLISGSHLYGTANEKSDVDFRGVFFAPLADRVAFNYIDDLEFEPDIKLFELRKFLKMLTNNNPNIMEWLFAPKSNVFAIDNDFNDIVFADKQQYVNPLMIQKTFVAYAMSEMSKLKKLNGDVGEKRRGYIQEFGYNTKSASNVLRVVTGGIDLCGHMHLHLPYENKELLLDIKNGKYTFEEFMSIALPRIHKLESLTGLKDRTVEIQKYAQDVLVQYIKSHI